MVVSYLVAVFQNGSVGLRVSMIVFILFLALLLVWAVFALLGLEELRQNREEVFQNVSDEELKEFEVLAEYKVVGKGEYVYFLDRGIAVRDYLNLRLVLYSDVLSEVLLSDIDRFLHGKRLPSRIRVPVVTPRRVRLVFGGQSLKLFLPIEDEKKRIVLENLADVLKGK